MRVLEKAHAMGLRVYGMLCPLLPGIANAPKQIDELVNFVLDHGAEEVFAEAVNPRGPGLKLTQKALAAAGHAAEAQAVAKIRNRRAWSAYVRQLIGDVQASMRRRGRIADLRFLQYFKGLTPQDFQAIREDDAGVVWL